MEGYMGTLLRINLSSRMIQKEPLDLEVMGGICGGERFQLEGSVYRTSTGGRPLGPENKIVISAGPCNGTLVPGSSRFTVSSKSPLTGFLGDSNAGGIFGVGLKCAGYDGIIIEGRADGPVYLWIDDERVELRDARHLTGKTPRETARAIQREHFDPEIYVISIGPAGEHLVRFGNLITDLGRGLGRTGQGAVFGSKNLKAVAVRGSKGVKVADPKGLREAVREVYDAWMGSAGKGGDLNLTLDLRARYGPAAGWTRYQKSGMFGTKNFQGGAWKRMVEELDDYYVKQKACFSCFAGCDHLFVIPGGPYAGAYGAGLELTTLDFGPNIGNEDMGLTAKLHERCDQYGMDYMDTRAAIGFAIECFERGILTEKDTDGLRLKWGDGETILRLIEKIVNKEGIGALLAEGLKRAFETIGKSSDRYAMQAKGQALVGRDPRASKGWGLAYAVSTRGPSHVRAHLPEGYEETAWDASVQKILRKYKEPTNPLSEEGKGELVKWHEDLQAFKNSMEIWLFIIYPWTVSSSSVPEMLARLYRSVTGIDMDEDRLLTAGERIVNLEKAFNIRERWTRKDDTLPQRVLTEPYPDGPAKGQVVNLEPMLEEYYTFRGWDKKTGLPKRDKLVDLDLNDVVDELQQIGKLAP